MVKAEETGLTTLAPRSKKCSPLLEEKDEIIAQIFY
jgi:hypothetical protein